jgi:hypothetical protein
MYVRSYVSCVGLHVAQGAANALFLIDDVRVVQHLNRSFARVVADWITPNFVFSIKEIVIRIIVMRVDLRNVPNNSFNSIREVFMMKM